VLDVICHVVWVVAATLGAWTHQSDCEGMYYTAVH
jgi:hypothetical protein